MYKGANSVSDKKMKLSPFKREDFIMNKSHGVSIHKKASQDPYSDIYKLPLKQIVQHIKQQQKSCSQRKRKAQKTSTQTHANTDLKAKSIISSRKPSSQQLRDTPYRLKTNCSWKQISTNKQSVLKRTKTQLQSLNQETKQIPYQKNISQPKKQYINIKSQDLMKLLSTYSQLKLSNERLTKQLDFYYNHMVQNNKGSINSALKALRM